MNKEPKRHPTPTPETLSASWDRLTHALSEKQLGYLRGTPQIHQRKYARALSGEASPRQAIKMKCIECVGFDDVKNQVGDCTSYRCPLWNYRPYQSDSERDQPELAKEPKT